MARQLLRMGSFHKNYIEILVAGPEGQKYLIFSGCLFSIFLNFQLGRNK